MNGTSWMSVSDGYRLLICLSLKSKHCYFHVILIISMLSLLADYNSMVIFKNIHLYVPLYRLNLYCVTIIIYCISFL